MTAFATLVALAAFTTSPAPMTQTVASLGGGTVGLTWGLSAMCLGLAAALLPLGALADNVGRRQVLLGSTALLAATSALAALAPTIGFFVGARMLRGIAGATGLLDCRAGWGNLEREPGARMARARVSSRCRAGCRRLSAVRRPGTSHAVSQPPHLRELLPAGWDLAGDDRVLVRYEYPDDLAHLRADDQSPRGRGAGRANRAVPHS